MKEIVDKLDFLKMRSICSSKDAVKRTRRQAMDWEKKVAKDTSEKGLLFKIYKEVLKLSKKKTNHMVKK